jgi:hypothetical protein
VWDSEQEEAVPLHSGIANTHMPKTINIMWVNTVHKVIIKIHWCLVYIFRYLNTDNLSHKVMSPLLVKAHKTQASTWCSWRTIGQGNIFIVPHLLWHGALVFAVSFKRALLEAASYDKQESWGPILVWIPSGVNGDETLAPDLHDRVLGTDSGLNPVWSKWRWDTSTRLTW